MLEVLLNLKLCELMVHPSATPVCATCRGATQCTSGFCSNNKCAALNSLAAGAGCTADNQCGADLFCDMATLYETSGIKTKKCTATRNEKTACTRHAQCQDKGCETTWVSFSMKWLC